MKMIYSCDDDDINKDGADVASLLATSLSQIEVML